MRGARAAMGASLGALVLGLVALGQAQVPPVEVTDQDRLWENFRREAAVVETGAFRIELQGITRQANRDSVGAQVIQRGTPAGNSSQGVLIDTVGEVSGGEVDLIGSYGLFENTEVGVQISGVFQGLRFFAADTTEVNPGGATENASTFGDMWLYAKYRYPVNEELGVGGGVEVRVPTGNVGDRTGIGEVGTEPFVAARYAIGRWAVGSTLGYQFNTGNLDDMFHWSVEGIARASDNWAFRTEFTGHNYDYGGVKINDVYCSPGIDYNFSQDFTLRPQGQVGMTDAALGWGIGVGLAYKF